MVHAVRARPVAAPPARPVPAPVPAPVLTHSALLNTRHQVCEGSVVKCNVFYLRDRTGAPTRAAREALQQAGGDVVEALRRLRAEATQSMSKVPHL